MASCSPWTRACVPTAARARWCNPKAPIASTSRRHAEAWEGIAYMKSRAVAGQPGARHGVSARAAGDRLAALRPERRSRKELAQMRARLEREQGPRNPLKAAAGGYYDIDFALMYLRLKGAGIFYQGAEHAGAHRRDRDNGPPGARGCRLPARGGHLLPRARPRPAGFHRPRRRQLAHIAGAIGVLTELVKPLDSRSIARPERWT